MGPEPCPLLCVQVEPRVTGVTLPVSRQDVPPAIEQMDSLVVMAKLTSKPIGAIDATVPESVPYLAEMGAVLGHQDIDFASHPAFSRRYLLRGHDENAVRVLFTDVLLTRVKRSPGNRLSEKSPAVTGRRASPATSTCRFCAPPKRLLPTALSLRAKFRSPPT